MKYLFRKRSKEQYWVMKRTILAALLSLTCSSSLFATKVMHTGFDMDRVMGIVIELDGEEHVAGAGVGLFSVEGSDPINTFCVNLFEGFAFFEEYTADSISALDYNPNGTQAGWLMQTFLPVTNTAIDGAALQLAIWDVIHDGGDGFDAGRIRSSSYTDADVLALARERVAESHGQSTTAANVYTASPGTPIFQQQLYLSGAQYDPPSDPPSDVPEPGTLAVLGVGGLAMVASRLRSI